MLDFIYTLFIAPLEYWMKVVLLWGHDKCADWGLAIILMSLVVNVVILPIYMKAESWQEEEQRRRLSFEAKEAMIRRSFHGQERFAMISTMRRQAGYTAFLSMRSSAGFFLQIPFFFAAYHFLSHFDPLVGVSFMGLADLSRPDEIAHIGPIPVNFMPILMTVINVGSALVYTKNLAKRDKIQLYSMAALFLVLLYDAASGLVLYWTCNNIFSLAKNIVYDLCRKLAPRLQGIHWQLSAPTEPMFETGCFWKDAWVLLLWLCASTLGSLSSAQATFLSEAVRVVLMRGANALFLLSALASLVEIWRLQLYRRRWILCVLILTGVFFTCKLWYKGEFISMARHGPTLVLALASMIPALSVAAIRMNWARRIYPHGAPDGLYASASTWFVVLIACYLPIQAFNTAPETFSAPDVILAKLLLFSAALGAVFWLLGKVFLMLHVEKMAGALFGFLALYFTVYAFLVPMDAGTIDGFQLSKQSALFRGGNLLLDVCVFSGLAGAYVWLLRRGYTEFLKTVFGVCVAFSFVAATHGLWTTRGHWANEQGVSQIIQAPSWNDRFLGFSKTGKNTVVLILDMFSGFHVDEILKRDEVVAEKFRDFTWYADCLATGPSTESSLASIVCGKACTPDALNQDTSQSLVSKINKQYAQLADHLGSDYDVCLNERNWLEPQLIEQYTEKKPLAFRYMSLFYLSRYMAKRGMKHQATSGEGFLMSVSLFSAVPWSLKNFIYEGGSWVGATRGHNASLSMSRLRDWAFLESFPELANANSKKGTFKLIYSEMTHWPWYMKPGSCEICKQGYPRTSGEIINPGHLQAETCTLRSLAKWIDWMRANRVYDNTTFIITSDHGHGVGRKSALLLVKPANAHQGTLRINRSPVELSDAAGMIFGKYPKEDPNRVRTFYTVGSRMTSTFRDTKTYCVRGPLMKDESWPHGKAYVGD